MPQKKRTYWQRYYNNWCKFHCAATIPADRPLAVPCSENIGEHIFVNTVMLPFPFCFFTSIIMLFDNKTAMYYDTMEDNGLEASWHAASSADATHASELMIPASPLVSLQPIPLVPPHSATHLPSIVQEQLLFQPEATEIPGRFGVILRGTWHDIAVMVKRYRNFTTHESQHSITHENLEQELAQYAALSHPKIVIMYGRVGTRVPYSLVMEYLPENVWQWLQQSGVLTDASYLQMAQELATAVEYLHAKQIVHGDIRASNVYRDRQGNIKLKLKPFARVLAENPDPQLRDDLRIRWLAPELFAQQAQCSHYSDVYSYGMTLWQMASRQIPFQEHGDYQVVIGLIQEGSRPVIPESAPITLRQVIQQAWVAESGQRPAIFNILKYLTSLR